MEPSNIQRILQTLAFLAVLCLTTACPGRVDVPNQVPSNPDATVSLVHDNQLYEARYGQNDRTVVIPPDKAGGTYTLLAAGNDRSGLDSLTLEVTGTQLTGGRTSATQSGGSGSNRPTGMLFREELASPLSPGNEFTAIVRSKSHQGKTADSPQLTVRVPFWNDTFPMAYAPGSTQNQRTACVLFAPVSFQPPANERHCARHLPPTQGNKAARVQELRNASNSGTDLTFWHRPLNGNAGTRVVLAAGASDTTQLAGLPMEGFWYAQHVSGTGSGQTTPVMQLFWSFP